MASPPELGKVLSVTPGARDLEVADKRSRHDGSYKASRARLARAVHKPAQRLSWGLADQAVSSMTNLVVGVYVARSLGATAFGMFTLAWVTYGLVLSISRGLATDPLVVRFSGVSTDAWRAVVSRASGMALLVGLLTGAASFLVGATLGGPMGAAFVALGFVLPALLLQDSWRYALFAAGRGRQAFTNDMVWAVTLLPAMIAAAQGGNVYRYLLAWGLSAAVAAFYGCIQMRLLPRLTGVRGWLREQRDLGPRYLIENLATSGALQLCTYGLSAIAGLVEVAAFRGAQLLLGPFLALMMGLNLVAVPEASRMFQQSRQRLSSFCVFLSAGQAGAALTWGLALIFLLPYDIGEHVLGHVWQSAALLILPLTLVVMAAGFSMGAVTGLRALGAARKSLRAQLLASTALLAGGMIGATANGALGLSWGMALGTLFGAAVWWAQLCASLRELKLDPRAAACCSPDLGEFRSNREV